MRRVERQAGGVRRITPAIRKGRQLLRVEPDAETAAQNQSALESRRTPRQTNLRSEVFLAGISQIALFHYQTSECRGALAEYRIADMAGGLAQRRIIFPAKAKIHREVRFNFPVLLNIEREVVKAEVFMVVRRLSRHGIEITAFLIRRIVGVAPQVPKVKCRPRRTSICIEKLGSGDVRTEFE